MVAFCPFCGNILFAQEELGNRVQFNCKICPVGFPLRKTLVNTSYYKLKEIEDILGGEEAWKNVDSTTERCPKCSFDRAYFMQVQTRSADEPMTTFYRCCNPECHHNWRD